jgi:peptide/nickel transport system permease protein
MERNAEAEQNEPVQAQTPSGEADSAAYLTPGRLMARRFFREKTAVCGLVFVILLILAAIAAPLFVNGKPLLIISRASVPGAPHPAESGIFSPALRDFFAPDAQEVFVEKLFNWLLLALPASLILYGCFRKRKRILWPALAAVLVLLAVPFVASRSQMTQIDWRKAAAEDMASKYYFAAVPYGPFETSPDTYAMPSRKHPFGTDNVGRDVFARMMYGARVSLAVGFLATAIELVLGTMIGLFSGYRGGRVDLVVQRLVEIVICFPTFLLLLILMAIMLDYGARQSILLVIFVLGMTGWPGLSRLVRGEVLKARQMAYIQSCESLGVPLRSILFRHLLPNVSGPIFVSFAFSIAGSILAENSLSFLGFGVQAPSASWGELLKQAFADPLSYWNLMLWPGLAIFLCVTAFNFIADGIRRSIDLKS